MYKRTLSICLLALSVAAQGLTVDNKRVLTHGAEKKASAELDRLLFAGLKKKGLSPSEKASDEVYLRRIYLDLTGTLPEPPVVRRFLNNKKPSKRAQVIRELMETEAFADYWTMKWCDLLRVKAEFPINMWPNGVQAYARWIRESISANMPYDEFARQLLTSNGSNFRTPAVNFYRGVQGEKPETMAAAAALTFMGTRLEKWPQKKQKEMSLFFSRIRHKGTAEWKEVIVSLDPSADTPLKCRFPDGRRVTVQPGDDPRAAFADWLIDDKNEWFTRNIANRVWSWVFGYGLIHEPDDIMPESKAVYPEVLALLEKQLVKSDYDLRHLFRVIMLSEVYQQSSKLNSETMKEGAELFARYPVRRLEAEVLLDALDRISGQSDEYMSMIPEPFTFVPKRNTNVQLIDGSITSKFLKMFGRPARDTGLESERNNEPSDDQRLHMLNSTHIQDKIQKSWKLRRLSKRKMKKKGPGNDPVNIMYLAVLSRFPTADEKASALAYTKKNGQHRGALDLFWALINSKEFLYRH